MVSCGHIWVLATDGNSITDIDWTWWIGISIGIIWWEDNISVFCNSNSCSVWNICPSGSELCFDTSRVWSLGQSKRSGSKTWGCWVIVINTCSLWMSLTIIYTFISRGKSGASYWSINSRIKWINGICWYWIKHQSTWSGDSPSCVVCGSSVISQAWSWWNIGVWWSNSVTK